MGDCAGRSALEGQKRVRAPCRRAAASSPARFEPHPDDRALIEQAHGRTLEEFSNQASDRHSPISWRRFYKLRRSGVLKTVVLMNHAVSRPVQSVARIRVNWASPRSAELEHLFGEDPAVTQAALVSGPVDFIVYTAHRDEDAAVAWTHQFQAHPAVSTMRVDRVRQRLNRLPPVEILLAGPRKPGCDLTPRPARPNRAP